MKALENLLQWLVDHDEQFFTMVIGLVIALVGPFITFYVGRSTDLHCVRVSEGQVRCDITRKLLGSQKMDERRVNSIQQAELEEIFDDNGDSTYRVIFVTSYGREPLTKSYSSGKSAKAELVERLNSFINSGQEEVLDYQVQLEWWVWLLLFGSIALGVGMILVSIRKFIQ